MVRGKREVVRGIKLAVPAGSIIGLTGPGEGGETILMSSIVGARIVRAGTVAVPGLPAGSSAPRRRVEYRTHSQPICSGLAPN